MEKIALSAFSLAIDALKGKVILITGASRGIGKALAFAAAKHGATVILISKNLKKLEMLYDEIVNAGYPEPAIHPMNLLNMDPKMAEELCEGIRQMFGRLDAIVHNAAISGPITPIEHLLPHKWQEIIHLNLNVPYLLTYALLPLLKETPYASILFTTANEAFKTKAYWSAYSASKSGLLSFATSLYEELEDNSTIRVNCINPGVARTALRVNAYPGLNPNDFPMPEDIVPSYLYLFSEQGKHIRGKNIELN